MLTTGVTKEEAEVIKASSAFIASLIEKFLSSISISASSAKRIMAERVIPCRMAYDLARVIILPSLII
jgi:hypothetical protein